MQALAHVKSMPTSRPDVDRATLAFLRVTAARSRCLSRTDLFEACAALSLNPAQEAEALAVTLFRGFSGQGGVPRLRFYQPAADEVSFDEHWLLSALTAAHEGDVDSLTFLVARRVPQHARRNIGFLVRALSKTLAAGAQTRAA